MYTAITDGYTFPLRYFSNDSLAEWYSDAELHLNNHKAIEH